MSGVETDPLKSAPAAVGRLHFGSGEWSGAFGDLGTLVPFLLAYVTVVGVAPSGMLLGLTGTAERVIHWIGRPVIIGITLGLGLAFMLQGTQLMATAVWFAAPVLLLTVLLLTRKAILAMLLILLALCFSESLAVLLRLFPQPALGVMLFLAGAQLALGSCDFARDKGKRFVTLGTAALAIWNVGIAFAFGIIMLYIARRGWLRL